MPFYTIEMTNARIVSIDEFLPGKYEQFGDSIIWTHPMEEVLFVYEQITWTSEPDIEYQSNWNTVGRR